MSWGRAGHRRSAAALLSVLAVLAVSCRDRGGDAFVGSATTVATTVPPSTTTPVTVPQSTAPTAPATTGLPTTTRPPRTTTTVGAPVPCSSLLLTVDATSAQATYRLGETVRILATLRNRSDVPCRYSSYGVSTRIDDASGQPVRPAPILTIDTDETVLEPGQTLNATPTWDQQICSGSAAPCSQAPPGRYKARAIWVFAGAPVEGAATFDLVGP